MPEQETLVVGGLAPFTTIDFPGRLAAVVFCQGCPWRCSYCHNPHLHPPRSDETQTWSVVRDWLETRRNLLDGVVFSGGEPLLQHGLAKALGEVRDLGFATAMHSAGIYPLRLSRVLENLNWIGLDIKGPFEDYPRITGAGNAKGVLTSLKAILKTGIDYELRCTVDTELLGAEAISRLAYQLATMGVSKLILQPCRRPGQSRRVPQTHIDSAAEYLPQVDVRYA